jgi:hypothetical protein
MWICAYQNKLIEQLNTTEMFAYEIEFIIPNGKIHNKIKKTVISHDYYC